MWGIERDRGAKESFLVGVLVCVTFSVLIFPSPGKAQILNFYTVNTTSDTVVPNACNAGGLGCSLRGAILAANASVGDDDIIVAIPASDPFCSSGVCIINLMTALPVITANVSLFGPGADKLTVKPATGVNIRVFTVSNAVVSINKCTISGNPGSPGGGIFNFGNGTINVTNSTISNSRDSHGAAIAITAFGTVNVTNSTISGNTADADDGAGGGIFSIGTLNIINSTITGNTAVTGGGIYGHAGEVKVTNSTVSGNSATEVGGGISCRVQAPVNVKNTIIALNTGNGASPDVSGVFVSAGFNLIGKRDGSLGFTAATDQTGTIAAPLNPMLDPAGLQNNGGPTRTIALLGGSPAIDKGTSSGLTGTLATDQRGPGFPRTFDNPAVPDAADGTDIGAFERRGYTPADFDGDGKTDVGIFRPGPAEWWINSSSDGSTFATQFGATTDRIAPADFTGDGKTDIAVWRPSTGFWFVLRSEDFSFYSFPFGANGDIPAPADYDADGKADAAVFRPSNATWYVSRSAGGTTIQQFGVSGDVPVVGDYDGDGRADIAIFRPGPGEWWINRSTAGVVALQFGNSQDKPVQGDYTDDLKSDVAFWRPSNGFWFILRSEDFSFFSFPFGTTGDIPAPGDYDGDGRHDATVFRPSSATWFANRSTGGTLIRQFGLNGDRPIPNAYVP